MISRTQWKTCTTIDERYAHFRPEGNQLAANPFTDFLRSAH
jgi:hypothetical protein